MKSDKLIMQIEQQTKNKQLFVINKKVKVKR